MRATEGSDKQRITVYSRKDDEIAEIGSRESKLQLQFNSDANPATLWIDGENLKTFHDVCERLSNKVNIVLELQEL